MGEGHVDPKKVLKGVEYLLGKDGGLQSLKGVAKVFSLMMGSHKTVSRCVYLNILLQTTSHDILNRFICVGGYKLLNSWLISPKTTMNTPLLQVILLTLQKLPLTVDHLKQNNTAKLVKRLSKSGETEELRKLASELVDSWMAMIRSPQPSKGPSFLDALNSAPVPEIKFSKKKPKAVSSVSNKPCPFDSKPQTYVSAVPAPPLHNPQDLKQPGYEHEAMDTENPNALLEPHGEKESLMQTQKKKKRVQWAKELNKYFYFDLDKTERVNVHNVKYFGVAAQHKQMMGRQTLEAMEERVPCAPTQSLTLSGSLAMPRANSSEMLTQRYIEMGNHQDFFLNSESVLDSPHKPDPEPYKPISPRLIPLDEVRRVPSEGVGAKGAKKGTQQPQLHSPINWKVLVLKTSHTCTL